MTNFEAIETLSANYPDACCEELREAVDKAIKALIIITAIPDHGDLIDRDALKDKAEFIGDAFSGRGGFAVWGTDVINAPAVIPAERR